MDFETEVDEGKEVEIVQYSYFERPMKTPLVLMANSSMGEHQKYSIKTNELVRRMSNVKGSICQKEKTSIVEKYKTQQKAPRYNKA